MHTSGLQALADQWLEANARRFSVFGVRGGTSWKAGVSAPMVLASAQKVLVLRALTQVVVQDPRFLDGGLQVRDLNRFYREGTDAGAHERSLLADGLGIESSDAWVPVSRLALYMMRYSSNAATDALATLLKSHWYSKSVEASPNGAQLELPPLIIDQLPSTSADQASRWYRASTRSLVHALVEMETMRSVSAPFDPFAYLPRLRGFREPAVRGKKGQVPGHRAGAIIVQPSRGTTLFAAYAYTTPIGHPPLNEAIEEALIGRLVSGEGAEAGGAIGA